MLENVPSSTARRVAIRRAAHQLLDVPPVLVDRIALAILHPDDRAGLEADPSDAESGRIAPYLRAFLAARSRIAEDELAQAHARGVRQYVLLGAGLDTFAYRNPHADLRVFEVDHPATQAWKRERLAEAGIAIPAGTAFVPVDFERDRLSEALAAAGFRAHEPAFFGWLGVTMYLTDPAFEATLAFIASTAAGGGVVFDYALSPSQHNVIQSLVYEHMARRVSGAGEPWTLAFVPSELVARMIVSGFSQVQDLGEKSINDRFFEKRKDGLRVGSLARILVARVGRAAGA